jgi:thiamine biosynthesis lipoprotein
MSDSPDHSNRRDFLKGKSAIDALRGQVDGDVENALDEVNSAHAALASDRQSAYLEQYSKNAMACEFELLFNLHQYPQSGAAAMDAFLLIDLLEDQMTIYRDHSEVSKLNREAFKRDVVVESRLFGLLEQAKSIFNETSCAFDITAKPLASAWGFDQRNGSIPEQRRIDEALNLVGSDFIELDRETHAVRFLKQGLGIDLGGIGKGHALDRVSELLRSKSINDFVIHGGQSSVLAQGSSVVQKKLPNRDGELPNRDGVDADIEMVKQESSGWRVGISHPTVPGVRLGELVLRNQALGTSGTGRQGFFHQGKRFGHIIDPRTGWPTSHFLSTTVVSKSAAFSDALATAFFVMSPEQVFAYCERNQEVSAILVSSDPKSKGQLQLDCINLEQADFRQMA